MNTETIFTIPKPCAWCGGKVTVDSFDEYEQVTMLLDSEPDAEVACERCLKILGGDQ